MFTGIVQGLCRICEVSDEVNLRRLTVDIGDMADGVELGASVAINGTCLTVTSEHAGQPTFDVISETLKLTNLGDLVVADLVNVERSFRVGDEIGGHILSGHISTSVVVAEVVEAQNMRDVYFRVPERWMKYLHMKGFVALDGASLTIASVNAEDCTISVSLIPETIARTTLGRIQPNARVNLEVDSQTQAVVDTVERVLDSPVWRDRLSSHGQGG